MIHNQCSFFVFLKKGFEFEPLLDLSVLNAVMYMEYPVRPVKYMKYYLNITLALLACWMVTSVAFSQETLEDKRKRADEYFKSQQWSEAEPLYASVISNAPRDHDLNFRYGVCLLYGSKNKEEAIRRLKYAVTGSAVNRTAYYYLGQAYHLNYQFNDAIKQYTKFKQVADAGQLKELNVETDLKACNHGKKLLANVTDMIVMQKTELGAERFYDLYKLDDIGGTLLITDEFQSKLDKKRNHRPVIHFPSESPYIYYSSYGEDGASGLDIYVKKKLPGGDWSLAQKVRGSVNTDQDEAYAYMHPGGEYLYFCSKGHNSMGGYDVFRSRYNPGNDTFGPPENMDFAISSPDDDLLFVVDSLDRIAYFSSARESNQGKLTVYKVRVDRIPMQMAVIKGNFLNTVNNDAKEIEIEVEDFSSGRIIGKFNSRKNNGDYLLTFPKAGKYKFILTPKGSDISHIYVVDIPYRKEFKPLKQRMTLQLDGGGEEEILVEDLFNEEFDDPVAILAEVYRELSKLPPNSEGFDLDSLDAIKATDEVLTDAGLDPYITRSGMEAVLKDEIEDLELVKKEEEDQANIAYNLALERSNLANEKMVELNQMIQDAESISDPEDKKRALQVAIEEKSKVEQLNDDAQRLINIAETIEKSIEEKEKIIAEAQSVLDQTKAMEDGDRDALIGMVKANQTFFIENVKSDGEAENIVTTVLRDGTNEQKRVQELSEEISDLAATKRDLIAKNKRLEKQMAAEKKKKVIEELQRQIDENLTEIDALDNNIALKTKKLDEQLNDNALVSEGIAAALILEENHNTPEYTAEVSESRKKEIAGQVESNDLSDDLAEVDRVLEENNVSIFNIDLYDNNDVTEGYSLEQWNEAIDQEKEKLKNERLTASKEKQELIDAELEKLERLREEKQSEYEVVDNNTEVIKPEINQDDIVPNYTRKKEGIGEIVNEEDRRKANLELNYELADEIKEERRKLEEILEDDPKNKNAQDRLDNLEVIEEDIKREIASDEQWVVDNESDNSFISDNVLAGIVPDYQRKITEAYEIVDEDERNRTIQNLNEVVIEKSNERIQELQAILDSDPDNQKAADELAYLEELVADIEANKDVALVEPELTNPDDLEVKVEPADLIKGFDDRANTIDEIRDETTKRNKENQLYRELVNEVRNELEKLDRLAEKYPDNKNIIKRQKALRDLDKDYNELISKNESWLDKNQPDENEFADIDRVKDVNPEYQARINRIDDIANKGERNESIQQLNSETLDKVNNRINQLDVELAENPENANAIQEKRDLEAIKERLENDDKSALIPPTDPATIETNPDVDDIMADYESRKADINNGEGSETDRLNDELELNKTLLEKIKKELRNIDELRGLHPDYEDRISQREASLQALEADILEEIAAAEEQLGVADNSDNTDTTNNIIEERQPVDINTLMPDYQNDLAAIDASDAPEKEKLENKNDLNRTLITAVDWKIKQLENEKSTNPDLTAVIDGEIGQLNEIKSEKEKEISDNQNDIANLSFNRPTINTESLMPGYENRMAAIDASDKSEAEKLEDKNGVDRTLIGLIDGKIEALRNEQQSNPALSSVIDSEIEKLNGIKSSKEQDIASNETTIADLNTAAANDTTDNNDTNNNTDNNDTTNNNSDNTNDTTNDNTNDTTTNNNDVTNGNDTNNNTADNNDTNNNTDNNDTANNNSDNNDTANNTNDNTNDANNTVRPVVSVGALMSDYESQVTDIRNGSGTDVEKLKRENELHEALIGLAENRIAEFEEEKAQNPDQAAAIQKDIDQLKDIKRSTENSIRINNDQIAQLETDIDRPAITIESLVPGFDDQMAAIDNSSASETEKLEQKNELNNRLIKAIDSKIYSVQKEWEEDPLHGYIYNEELDKLEELKESKRNEVSRNNETLAAIDAEKIEVSEIKPDDFATNEARTAASDFEDQIAEINELDNDIEELNNQLASTDDPKDQKKIQKNLDKANVSKARLENEVIEGFEEANTAEAKNTQEEFQIDRDLTASSAASNEDILTAEENITIARQKFKQARSLRNEAENIKDPVLANEKLNQAFQLENEANALLEESQRIFKAARAIDNYADEEEVITSVPDNVAERKSTALLDEAAELREVANNYYDRANELRDSSATVKTKYQADILNEADAIEAKGDVIARQADDKEEEAEELKAQEDLVAAGTIDEVNKTISSETQEEVSSSETYKAYFAEKNAGDEKLAEAEAIENQINELKNKRTRRFKMAVSGGSGDPESAIEDDQEIAETQDEINRLTSEQKRLRDEALNNYKNARAILSASDADDQENMIALEQNGVQPIERKEPSNADFDIPDNLTENLFRTTDGAVYSDETPIPLGDQPSGLVYKIQVGAFRNPLPQDHFNEFAPISGEKLNNGITRYMVGYFTTFDPANSARSEVNRLGYSDAFVVAYCNGERISIDRAKLIEEGLIDCDATEAPDSNDNLAITNPPVDNNDNTNDTNNDQNNTTDTNTNTNDNTNTTDQNNNNDTASNNDQNNNTTDNNATNPVNNNSADQSDVLNINPTTDEERRLTDYYTSVPDAAKANQIEIIKGLFYTVQIGVYSKPVPPDALYNIQPLNSQRAPNGYIRYSTGIFTSEEAATVRKDEVVDIGISDAFVTAYFDGERITVEQALQILVRDGADALVGNQEEDGGQSTTNNTDNTNTNTDTNTGEPEAETFFKEGLHYRILIGKYEDAIPGEYATILLQGGDVFETEVDQEGRTCLISSKLNSFDELEDRLFEFSDLGIEDMRVISYYKYDVIPFEEGEKIRNDEDIKELNPYDDIEGISANRFIYSKEAVYFKIKLGEFEDKVPSEFTNLLLLHQEEENISKEETINDEIIFITGSMSSYDEAETTKQRLLSKGFERAVIIAFHKYDEISVEKAREILEE